MQAVVFLEAGRWILRDVEEPRLERPDDVLLEVESAGICGTDLHILSDPPGHPAKPGTILGHEYVARVREIGQETRGLRIGDRVVVDPNIPCGRCEFCRLGRTNMCAHMTTLGIFTDGGLARYNIAPAGVLHLLDPDVAPNRAVLAEPLSCIYAAFEKAPPHPGDRVVILGAGPIGLMFLLLYRQMGAETIVAVEPKEFRRQIASDLGADYALDFQGANVTADVRKLMPSGADIVIDAVGTLMSLAVDLARPGGRVLLFGMDQRASQAVSQYAITRKELTVIGSFIQRNAFPSVTRLLKQKDFPIEKIVSHSFPLNKFGEALDSMRKGRALKVILEPTA